jgi:hypothetical protein
VGKLQHDSGQWIGVIGEPWLPPDLQALQNRPVRNPAQIPALGAALLLLLSATFPLAASALADMAAVDFRIAGPDIHLISFAALIAGLTLLALGRVRRITRPCTWLAIVGAITTALASIAYVPVALWAHESAVAGPALRADVARLRRNSRRSVTTIFRLRDGTFAATSNATARRFSRLCLSVRRLHGPWGFSWLRVVESSPSPQAGGLAWPIDHAACFSDADLASIKG